MRQILLALLVGLWIGCAQLALAASNYYVATTGFDGNDCTSATGRTNARQSINAGLACAVSGDTVTVIAGTYTNQFLSNTIPSGVTLKSEVQGGAVLRVTNPTCGPLFPLEIANNTIVVDGFVIDATASTCGVTGHIRFKGTAHHITIQNMELKGGHNTAQPSTSQAISHPDDGFEGTRAYITIRNNKIHDIGNDITPGASLGSYGYYWAGSGVTFENNEIWNTGGFAIHNYCTEYLGCNFNIMRNNYIHDTWNGVLFSAGGQVGDAGGGANQVYNNVIANTSFANQGNALKIGGIGNGTNDVKVYHNTIYHNYGPCIKVGGAYNQAWDTKVKNNLCYQNGTDGVDISEGQNGGHPTVATNNLCSVSGGFGCTVIGNPNFISTTPGNKDYLHLAPGSIALGAGVDVGISPDKDGNVRPPVSIGAYEAGTGNFVASTSAHWPFDVSGAPSLADVSGNGNNLTLASPVYVPGQVGTYALSFSGTPNGATTTAFSNTVLTWAMWVNGMAAPTGTGITQPLGNGNSDVDNFGFSWNHPDPTVRQACYVLAGDGHYRIAALPSPPAPLLGNTWYHLASTFDGMTLKCYLNGQPGPSMASPGLYPTTGLFHVGGADTLGFSGLIDDVYVYNRVLTDTDILTLYRQTAGASRHRAVIAVQ